jgi:hypothetical protein
MAIESSASLWPSCRLLSVAPSFRPLILEESRAADLYHWTDLYHWSKYFEQLENTMCGIEQIKLKT